jgi:choline kinase
LLHQLNLLAASGVEEATVITGFGAEQIQTLVKGRARCVYYPDFASTNNLLTLHHCRHLLAGDVLILFSDVLLPRRSLQDCVDHPGDFALLVDTSKCLEGTMRVRYARGAVLDIGPHILAAEGDGNFIGVAKYSARGAKRLAEELERMVATSDCADSYYTSALARLATGGHRLDGVRVDGRLWIEIDTPEDYLAAQGNDFYLSDFARPAEDHSRR